MDWFSGNALYGALAAGASAALIALYHFFNPTPPVIPRWRLWANRAAVVVFVLLVVIGMFPAIIFPITP